MNKYYSVTIGISAYNEMQNIGELLKSLLNQKNKGFLLENILVISDGSTDKTGKIVKSFKNKKVVFISSKVRKGIFFRINQIIERTNSDILIILNADILPKDDNFLISLIEPIINRGADLTSGALRPITPSKRFEKIVFAGEKIKTVFFENYKFGNNLYTCRGTSRAFSKKLYKKIKFPNQAGDDTYSYLYCVINNYKYCFAKNAIVYFKLPENYKDFEKQIIRFSNITKKLSSVFGDSQIKKYSNFSKILFTKEVFKYALTDFIGTILYCFLFIYIRSKNLFKARENLGVWETSQSTKFLNKTYETKQANF